MYKLNEDEEKDLFSKYEILLNKIVNRKDEVRGLIKFLHKETTWLEAPASSKYHNTFVRGLLKHSVDVAIVSLKIGKLLAKDISEESLVLTGLFHDVGKIGGTSPKGAIVPRYLKEKDLYRYNPDVVEISLGARSLYYVSKFVSLSDAEAQTILCHDGLYVEQNQFLAHRETPLMLLVHWADYWVGHVLESRRFVNQGNEGIWRSLNEAT